MFIPVPVSCHFQITPYDLNEVIKHECSLDFVQVERRPSVRVGYMRPIETICGDLDLFDVVDISSVVIFDYVYTA